MGNSTLNLIENALHSDNVSSETWSTFLITLEEARDYKNFVANWAYLAESIVESWYGGLPNIERYPPRQYFVDNINFWAYRYLSEPLLNHHASTFANAMSELLEIAPLPYYEAESRLQEIIEQHNLVKIKNLPLWKKRDPGQRFVAAFATGHFWSQARLEARCNVTRIVILLTQYRREFGEYPDKLDEIKEGFGGQIPLNPFSGEPYLYERDGDSIEVGYLYDEDGGSDDNSFIWTIIWSGHDETLERGL